MHHGSPGKDFIEPPRSDAGSHRQSLDAGERTIRGRESVPHTHESLRFRGTIATQNVSKSLGRDPILAKAVANLRFGGQQIGINFKPAQNLLPAVAALPFSL